MTASYDAGSAVDVDSAAATVESVAVAALGVGAAADVAVCEADGV
jgi:hypothetical protein